MAKRNYREEYQRRIEKGLTEGYSRAQAAGHPRKGESGIKSLDNFFKELRQEINNMITDINHIFEGYADANCKVEYDPGHSAKHTYVLPHWYVGGGGCVPDKKDFENLWSRVRQERPQQGYAMWITGTTEEEYPGKKGELTITLSYRLHWRVIDEAINDRSHRTLVDVVNSMIPDERKERWLSIEQVAIVNKA